MGGSVGSCMVRAGSWGLAVACRGLQLTGMAAGWRQLSCALVPTGSTPGASEALPQGRAGRQVWEQ